MERITDRTLGPHRRGAYGTPSVARDGIRKTSREHGRGSGPARPGGIDPAFIRANVVRMRG